MNPSILLIALLSVLISSGLCLADKFGNQNQQAKLISSGSQPQFSIESLGTATSIAHLMQTKQTKCTESEWIANSEGLLRQSGNYGGMSAKFCYNMLIRWDGTLVITSGSGFKERILFKQDYPNWTFQQKGGTTR
jgi:hypothetical protein